MPCDFQTGVLLARHGRGVPMVRPCLESKVAESTLYLTARDSPFGRRPSSNYRSERHPRMSFKSHDRRESVPRPRSFASVSPVTSHRVTSNTCLLPTKYEQRLIPRWLARRRTHTPLALPDAILVDLQPAQTWVAESVLPEQSVPVPAFR